VPDAHLKRDLPISFNPLTETFNQPRRRQAGRLLYLDRPGQKPIDVLADQALAEFTDTGFGDFINDRHQFGLHPFGDLPPIDPFGFQEGNQIVLIDILVFQQQRHYCRHHGHVGDALGLHQIAKPLNGERPRQNDLVGTKNIGKRLAPGVDVKKRRGDHRNIVFSQSIRLRIVAEADQSGQVR